VSHTRPGATVKAKRKRPRNLRVAALATIGVAAGLVAQPLFAAAEDSTPLPPDTDLANAEVSVVSGTTVRVAQASMRLITTSDKALVTPGSKITYTYRLTNTSATPAIGFRNVSVEDDKCQPVAGPAADADTVGVLDPAEVWTFTCTTTVLKDQTNAAKARGIAVFLDGTPTTSPSPSPSGSIGSPTPTPAGYVDGTYLGSVARVTVPGENVAYDLMVQAVISGGRITAITVPTHTETDTTSRNILRFQVATTASLNSDPANPTMIFEAIQSQSANIAALSGATYTTAGFKASLSAALAAATR
jgi:uncharacterized repeat protein (TIGR01451 family)